MLRYCAHVGKHHLHPAADHIVDCQCDAFIRNVHDSNLVESGYMCEYMMLPATGIGAFKITPVAASMM